jgi:hypothetical protein
MKSRRLGLLFILMGILFSISYQYIPQNIIVYNFSIPAGVFLTVAGIILLAFDRNIYYNDIKQMLYFIFFPSEAKYYRKIPIINFLQISLQENKLGNDRECLKLIEEALNRQGVNDYSLDSIKKILVDHDQRRLFANRLGIFQFEIDRLFLDYIADSDQKNNHFSRESIEHRKFRTRLLVALGILVPIAMICGMTFYSKSQMEGYLGNYQLQEKLASLLCNGRLDKEDFDDIQDFLKMAKNIPVTPDLDKARNILTIVFSNPDSIEPGWAKAYESKVAEIDTLHVDGIINNSKIQNVSQWLIGKLITGANLNTLKIRSCLFSLYGMVCAKYSQYGTHDIIAIKKSQYFYASALTFYQSFEVNRIGLAAALKYELQNMPKMPNAEFTLKVFNIENNLERALASSSISLFQRARILNNKADLFLHIENRYLSDTLIAAELDGLERQPYTFWREIRSLLREGDSGVLDTAQSFLSQASLFYPTGLPEFLVTRAQIHSLRAKMYFFEKSDSLGCYELERSLHFINAAFSRGFRNPIIFYADNRKKQYFDSFDNEKAISELKKLQSTVGEYFGPQIENKIYEAKIN